ncbi:MAG: AAA family ATPase [Magnetococcales bacterium]|nr:AAA family ATPase [Magnetococcales bacterium]MBF0155863.1 AAA family ATPase [Magnetococcales bacterium]
MNQQNDQSPSRIERMTVKNYRALRDVTFKSLPSLTVLLGANGSGKSTVFDVFAFLSECFQEGGLRRAWDKRGRFKELRSRDQDGNIVIELAYREHADFSGIKHPRITYHLEIREEGARPVVAHEWMRWKRQQPAAPFHFLNFKEGKGQVISGEKPEFKDSRIEKSLGSQDLLAVGTLGNLRENPRVMALKKFITGWHLSYLSANSARIIPDAGPVEKLSQTGDNLANVIQFLKEQHSDRLNTITETLRRRVPRLEGIDADMLESGHLLLKVRDAPFSTGVQAKYLSDGTLKMLAYLVLLNDPNPSPLIGLEEPENYLHPKLLIELAEECNQTSGQSQMLITTHSPFFINGMQPEQVWALGRGVNGYTRVERAADMPGIREMMRKGAKLGDLWMEGYFDMGDPR